MPDEIAPQTANASEPAAPAAAPAAEPQSQPGVTADPSPAAEPQAADPNAAPANTGEPGAAPADEPKVPLKELLAQRKRAQEAERRAAYLEGKLDGTKPPAPAAQPQADKEPVLDDFDGPNAYEDWVSARTEYRIEQKQKIQSQTQRIQQQAVTEQQQWNQRCQQAATEIPDIDEVLGPDAMQPFPALQPVVVSAIKKIDLGPQVVYYLYKNPVEGIRLAQMDPVLAVMELAGIREKAKAALQPKIKKVTTAAPPLNPGSGGGTTVDTDLADLPMAEYMARREQQTFVKVGGKLVPQ